MQEYYSSSRRALRVILLFKAEGFPSHIAQLRHKLVKLFPIGVIECLLLVWKTLSIVRDPPPGFAAAAPENAKVNTDP